jgi:hypothetical protein
MDKDFNYATIETLTTPTEERWVVVTEESTMLMTDAGGRDAYGSDDWQLVLDGFHPDVVECEPAIIVLH